MTNLEKWIVIAQEDCGFEEVGRLNQSALHFIPEVREMCSANRCNKYNVSWSCPPACGTLDEIIAKTAQFQEGMLVQSVGKLEDEFDFEQMMEIERWHKDRFYALVNRLHQEYERFYAMSAGACTLCSQCTYPDKPCRFQEKLFPSMEACGLMVSDVCRDSGMKYNYGKCSICYTSCILISDVKR